MRLWSRNNNSRKLFKTQKKKDVLALQLSTYKKYADDLCKGFSVADKLLQEERIFSSRDLPYTTQLIPLAAICTELMDGNKIYTTTIKKDLQTKQDMQTT